MKCTACHKEHTKKEVIYTDTKVPYCANPFTCNDDHPNSVKNIVARGGAIQMFTEDELESNLFATMNVTPEMKERIMKIATKPQSIRLSKLEIAHYLILLQESKGLASISEAVRYCVTKTMVAEPIKYEAPEPEPEVLKLGSEMIEIPIIPNSVNVDWNTVKEPEKEKEEEFTF